MYSEVFCKVYNELGWNYYPEAFGAELLQWMAAADFQPRTALDLGCGTGVLSGILAGHGVDAMGMDYSEGMVRMARENYPDLTFEQGDMRDYRKERQFDLVTCTGDALNHIHELSDVERVFANTARLLAPGGYFLFDILSRKEGAASEPFELEFSDTVKVIFQIARPAENRVELHVRVLETGCEPFEEVIRETIHDPDTICSLLEKAGLQVLRCADSLREDSGEHGTTWFVIARKRA